VNNGRVMQAARNSTAPEDGGITNKAKGADNYLCKSSVQASSLV